MLNRANKILKLQGLSCVIFVQPVTGGIMRVLRIIFLSFFLFSFNIANATLSTIGQKGMLHTIIAGNEGKGMIGIGGYGLYWQSPLDFTTMTTEYKRGIGNYFVTYVPYNFIEAFISQAAGAYQQERPKERNVGVGDTYLGLKFSRKLRSFIHWGIYSSLRMPTGEQDYGSGTGALENDILLTMDLTRYEVTPFMIHFNLGYIMTGEGEPETYEESNGILIRSAVVIPSHIFSPFIEYSTYQATGMEDLAFSESPILLTPGLAFYLPYGLSCQAGVDIPISKVKPYKRRAVASVSWVIPLKELLKPFGARTLFGQVLDKETGLPVGSAKVRIINSDLPPKDTNNETGIFKFKNLSDDFSTIMIEKEGYKKLVKLVEIKKGEEKSYQFRIEQIKEGKVSGRIIDKFSSKPVVASISIIGSDENFQTNPDGRFTISIEEGISELTFTNDEYESYRTTVNIKKGEEEFLLVKMRPIEKRDKLIGIIYFESNKAVINDETEEIFLKAIQYLRENPGVKIEVGGHTDNTGGEHMNLELSRVRAESVREHILSQYGVNPEKIIAKGYGEWIPIDSNDTKKGRHKNRRAEIKIIWVD